MKHTIKTHTLLCAAALLFCACSPGQTQAPSSTPQENPVQPETTIALCRQGTQQGYYNIDVYFENCASVTYIDYAQKKEIFLCNAPGCAHNTEACLSYVPLDNSMAIPAVLTLNDMLLFVQTGASETANPHIAVAESNGGNKRTVVAFPAHCVILPTVYSDGTSLFFFLSETDAKTTLSTKKVMRVTLADGNAQTLYEYPADEMTPSLVGALGNQLIVASLEADETGILRQVYRTLDTATGQLDKKALASFAIDEAGSLINGNLLYEIQYANCKIKTTNLKTGETAFLDYACVLQQNPDVDRSDVAVFPVFDSILRIETVQKTQTESIFKEYVMDAQTGQVIPFHLTKPYNGDAISVLAVQEDALFVCRDFKKQQLFSTEQTTQFSYLPQYAMISKTDFRNSAEAYVPIVSDVTET